MTRPNIQIPNEFAINGEKSDFTQEKIQTGFDKLNPDIFAGDNINKFIDDTYKGLNGVLGLYNGVVLHEMTTTYDDKAVVGKFIENSFKLYRSLVNDNTGHEVTETEYWEEVALGGGSGFNLFDTKTSDHVLEGQEAFGWALQGTYVYKEAIAGSRFGYPFFYAKCLEEKEQGTATETTLGDNTVTMYVNANGHKFYDIADKTVIDNWYNTYGIADFYGVDTENERIFLPRNDKFIQLTGDTSKVNDTIEAGLPNIEGAFETSDRSHVTTGAFYTTSGATARGDQNGSTGNWINLDASRSSSVYGNSDTVQPPSSLKLLYYCVGNTKVESAISNVTEITTSENDTLPLFYNFYSQEDMTTTGAYVNASLGSWLSGNVYTTAYNELVNKLGTDNVKANTDTYTDYDFVVNQDDMTFRLPLLNGDEDIVDYSNGTTFALATNFTAPSNGVINTSTNAYSGDMSWYWTINGGEKHYIGENQSGMVPVTVSVSKDDVFYITGVTDNSNTLYFYPYKGNGNLYYKLSNAVTNLEILDVAEVTADLNTKISKTECPAYIVETYRNGTSWYRVWSDGWCEQGGMVIQGTGTSSYLVTYLVEMKDINYTAQVSPIIAENDDTGGDASDIAIISGSSTGSYPYGKTTTQLRLSTYSNAKNGFNWEVKGYKK